MQVKYNLRGAFMNSQLVVKLVVNDEIFLFRKVHRVEYRIIDNRLMLILVHKPSRRFRIERFSCDDVQAVEYFLREGG